MTEVAEIYVVRRDGERLDRIARLRLGTWTGGVVERILDMNPGLAALPAILPIGTRIALPPRPAPVPVQADIPRIWGST